MNRLQLFLDELQREATPTRKMLSAVPDDKYDWKPHPKSMTIRQLAGHIAELPGWIDMTLNTNELDFAANPYASPDIKDTAGLLAYFEKNLESGKKNLLAAKDENLDEPWTLRNGEQVYSTEPKADVIRMSISQIIHHRAQLGVFLRLLDVPIPGTYGPSADDESFN
jgi:uncharacterized damage-inducible protein DinB